MHACDIQVRDGVQNMNSSGVVNAKTSAKTARNGSSFLAIIEKMIHGAKDGKEITEAVVSSKKTARGAGNSIVPGEKDILKKQVSALLHMQTEKGQIIATEKNTVAKEALKGKNKKGLLEKESSIAESKEDANTIAINALVGLQVKNEDSISVKTDQSVEGDSFLESEMDQQFNFSENVKSHKDSVALFSFSSVPPQGIAEKKDMHKESTFPGEAHTKKAIIGVKNARARELKDENTANVTPVSSFVEKVVDNGDGTADMSIVFKSSDNHSSSTFDSVLSNSNKGNETGQSFASMLSSELRENAADFVKTGQIILKDNNSGLIRLNLNPASLGNVRINLELADRKISGRIIVDSKEAYEAFNESLDSLSQAFVEGGFTSAGFDLSWSGNNPSHSSESEQQGKISSPFYASSIPDVMSSDISSDSTSKGNHRNGYALINVLA